MPGGGIGDFVPAAAGNPIWHFLPYMRAFTLASPAQFRLEGPPPLSSAAYAEAFDEVKELGRSGGAALTSDQQEAARFHTENPNLFWPRASRVFMNQSSVLETVSPKKVCAVVVSYVLNQPNRRCNGLAAPNRSSKSYAHSRKSKGQRSLQDRQPLSPLHGAAIMIAKLVGSEVISTLGANL